MKEFKIGDKVRAAVTVHEPASEDLPYQELCEKGDILEIRDTGVNNWSFYVAHPQMRAGASFGVTMDEIEEIKP